MSAYARDLRHPDDRARVEAKYQEVLRGERQSGYIEARYRHRGGHYLSCVVSITVVRDSRGRALYFTAEVEDITSRRAAESRLLLQTAELERANRELTRSNAELERFAFVASHDLQEPLRKIRVFGDRLNRRINGTNGINWQAPHQPSQLPADSAQNSVDAQRFLDAMTRAAERMQNLINDLLEYGRLQQQVAAFHPVDLNALWRDLIEDFEGTLSECNGRVEVESLPTVSGDAARLRQLFANLLSNALKFRGENTPLVRVSSVAPEIAAMEVTTTTATAEIALSGASVAGASVAGASVAGASVAGASVAGASVAGASVAGASVAGASVAGASVAGASVALDKSFSQIVAIEVADNGIGFDPASAEAIFEVFRRLHGRTKYPGTGIGLAICRRIAREHNGDVRAYAPVTGGARFVVTLPGADELVSVGADAQEETG